MMVEIPLLDSSGPAIASGSSGTQCPIPNCSGDGSKRHAFECHLPAIFREELDGQEITIRRIGALSMIASWHLGDHGTLRLLAHYFHLMYVGTTFDQSVAQDQQRAMCGLGWELNPHRRLCCPMLGMKNESWFIGRWRCGY